ncbi:uncharacterized protein [Montipora foliosa]|uniref:uncharacterized protein n=1 Tax=Montipora foliosa TaxID=591990 RepID=UPI0035F145BC
MKAVGHCVTATFLFTNVASAAEGGSLFSKATDETLLTLATVFFVISIAFLLLSILTAIVLVKKVTSRRKTNNYDMAETEEQSQNVYIGKNNGMHDAPPSQYEVLQLQNTGNGMNQSTENLATADSSQNGNQRRTLSSFQNPAYDTSVPYGLDDDTKL